MRKVKIDSVLFSSFSPFNTSLFIPRKTFCKISSVIVNKNDSKNYFNQSIQICSTIKKYPGFRNFSGNKKMEDDCKYPDIFSNEEFVQRRLSTFEDVQVCISLLKEVLEYRKKSISSWIVEVKYNFIKCPCFSYVFEINFFLSAFRVK